MAHTLYLRVYESKMKGKKAMGGKELGVQEIRKKLQSANAQEFTVLERSLVADSRKGVRSALEVARRRLAAEKVEAARLASLYAFERKLADEHGGGMLVGLDEVGRGPLAGPLAVGAVVLPKEPYIEGLNDSKQVKPADRERIAQVIKQVALAWSVVYVKPHDIDKLGMSASLKSAFRTALANIEQAGISIQHILLDGNPLHMDEREINIIKGDSKCASIAAASIVAKVERDNLMCELAKQYPEYGFAENKGYASAAHIQAIKKYGTSAIHRESFCTSFTQATLF